MKQKNLIISFVLVTLLLLSGMNIVYAAAPSQEKIIIPSQEPNIIASPNPVLEVESFTVTVKDDDGNPVKDVLVIVHTIPKKYGITNKYGRCSFIAPTVNINTYFDITAAGFIGTKILVRAKSLHMNFITVDEGKKFKQYVYDQDGIPVAGALVTFLGESYLTDIDGYSLQEFTAPWVYDEYTSYLISTYKTIYTSGISGVGVINSNDPGPITITAYVGELSQGTPPIQDAIVSANTQGSEFGITGQDGYCAFDVHLSHNGQQVTFTTSCDGYQSQSKTYIVTLEEPIHIEYFLNSL